MTGSMIITPGPFAPISLPSLNTTTLSYSRITFIDDAKIMRMIIPTTAAAIPVSYPIWSAIATKDMYEFSLSLN